MTVKLPELSFEEWLRLHDMFQQTEGWRIGLRHALGLILETRGLQLSAEQKQRVKDCDNGWQIRSWVRRAITISSTDELFEETPDTE